MGLRQLAPKLALSLGVVLALFLLGECGLWVAERFERDRSQLPRFDPVLAAAEKSARLANEKYNARFRLSKNETLIVEMDPEDPRLNSDGLRDREYSTVKPPNTVRILAVGDSLTYGHSVKAEEAYVKKLEARLNEGAAAPRYEVINLGVGGYNTLQELEHFRQTGRKYDPDLVIIGYTLNDVLDAETFLRNINGLPPEEGANSGIRRSRLLRWILDRTAQVNVFGDREAYFIPLYRDPESWGVVSDSFREFSALGKEDGFRVLVVIFPFLDGDLATYPYGEIHEQVEDEALANGFAVLDLRASFDGRELDEIRLAPSDPVHPNEKGYSIIASEIFSHIEKNPVPITRGRAYPSHTGESVR
jgi:lysophospholipase L1-like esterase